jgi:hypothetical protein
VTPVIRSRRRLLDDSDCLALLVLDEMMALIK